MQSLQPHIAQLTEPRRLSPDDRSSVTAHLLRLSMDDRNQRFSRVINDEGVIAYAGRIDFDRDVCFGVFDACGILVALAQGFRYADNGEPAMEAAFSTDLAWRQRGLGQLLFAEVIDHALALGVVRVIAQCLAGNRAMRALLRAVGAACEVEDGEVIAAVAIDGSRD